MKTFVSTLILFLAVAIAEANPIPVKSFKQEGDGVSFIMETGVMKLQVCGDRIVRVVYGPKASLPDSKSVAVIKDWTPVPFEVRENLQAITVSTSKLQVAVDRKTGAVQFLDPAGKPILSEVPGGGKSLTPAVVNKEQAYRVEQSFQSPADETLYGLGQYQEGTWNWRGIPLELRQCNTQISIPVLVSSKGYGLLWDNASLTDFNPADQEIPLSGAAQTGALAGPLATEELGSVKQEKPAKKGDRTGIFTTGAAGEYVFAVRDADRKGRIGVSVDGKELALIKNTWVPYGVSAKITLPANKTLAVKLLGGGAGAKVFARPLGDKTVFRSSIGDTVDYYFFYGPKLDDVVAGYRLATGAAPLFPKWAYGFWQCRERYDNQKMILDAASEYRKRQIPVDLIVQDWQYWGHWGWGAYNWEEKRYPQPAEMIKKLHEQNIRFMISVWSNPKGGPTNKELQAMNGFVPVDSDLAGKPNAKGQVPVPVWYDAFNPKARDVRWQGIKKSFFDIGTDAWWQDAAEPGDDGNAINNCQIYLGNANRYRNAYTLFTNRSLYDGQRAASADKRVCILTRSAYAGQQRYAAASWSGDIKGDWETFRRQLPAGLNFSLTGIPYWTTDTAGFFRPKNQYTDPDFNELLTRWFQMSTFCPILRVHGYKTETELWKWPLAEQNLIKYNKLRYRLLPYNYSVAWKITNEGYTPMRALVMDFADDPKTHAIDDQYMFGPAFLVSPVFDAKATARKLYLPAGCSWINFWTGETQAGGREINAAAALDTLPLFVRAGSIIPIGPALQYAMEKSADPIELRVYRGANGAFTLYEDEGDNYNYERGTHATIPITWDDAKGVLTIGARAGSYPGMPTKRTFNIVFVGKDNGVGDLPTAQPDKIVAYDGQAISTR